MPSTYRTIAVAAGVLLFVGLAEVSAESPTKQHDWPEFYGPLLNSKYYGFHTVNRAPPQCTHGNPIRNAFWRAFREVA